MDYSDYIRLVYLASKSQTGRGEWDGAPPPPRAGKAMSGGEMLCWLAWPGLLLIYLLGPFGQFL